MITTEASAKQHPQHAHMHTYWLAHSLSLTHPLTHSWPTYDQKGKQCKSVGCDQRGKQGKTVQKYEESKHKGVN